MRNFLYAATGFLAGTALIVGVSLIPRHTAVVSTSAAMPMSETTMSKSSGGTMMGMPASAPASRKLTIQHVVRGCHTWSNGKATSPMMRMTLRAGGMMSILDQDLDAHRLVQLSGPTRLHLGGPMMMNQRLRVSFPHTGVYRFRTKTVEMPGVMGMEEEAETSGPDNTLRLIVTVV